MRRPTRSPTSASGPFSASALAANGMATRANGRRGYRRPKRDRPVGDLRHALDSEAVAVVTLTGTLSPRVASRVPVNAQVAAWGLREGSVRPFDENVKAHSRNKPKLKDARPRTRSDSGSVPLSSKVARMERVRPIEGGGAAGGPADVGPSDPTAPLTWK